MIDTDTEVTNKTWGRMVERILLGAAAEKF